MDPVERKRKLQAGVVALFVTALMATSCIADEEVTASFGQVSTTRPELPVGTEPPESSAVENQPDPTGAVVEAEPSTTATSSPEPLLGLGAELIADGFDQPVLVTGAPGIDALFVVEREGVILVVEDGVVADTPFLDLTDQILSSSIEQGLLGLAFHPGYEDNRRFYAYWTNVNGDSRLGQFHASRPTTADPDSLRIVLEVEQPAERHNAGMIMFGPDGLLYLALGDGGAGGSTSQDTSSLLGSILRLDVDSGDPYSIPPGNPFGDEIWVYGLRNPWRFSIDPVEELMYIGDVGQERYEEINIAPLDAGGMNFGWYEMEGDECFRQDCDQQGLTTPTLQYSHIEGCSITGGWVYRGAAIPEFYGHYFYADWCKGFVRSMHFDNGRVVDQFDWTSDLGELGQVTSFGLDNDGELYAVNWDGQLFKIVPVR